MITVYGFGKIVPFAKGVTRDLRVFWALEEVGLAYRIHPIDGTQGEQRGEAYRQVNPFGLIPAIEDDGFTLYESGAILSYIADKTGKLAPKDAKTRALAAQWSLAALNTLEPPLLQIFAVDKIFSDQPWAASLRAARVEQAQRWLPMLDVMLGKQPYLAGAEFGTADILMASVLRFVQHTDLLSATPYLAVYKARCEKRPAFEKALSDYNTRLGG